MCQSTSSLTSTIVLPVLVANRGPPLMKKVFHDSLPVVVNRDPPPLIEMSFSRRSGRSHQTLPVWLPLTKEGSPTFLAVRQEPRRGVPGRVSTPDDF